MITNGAKFHNVEDILATLRTSFADYPDTLKQQAVANGAAAPFRREIAVADIAEEASEFDLPAIFKPGHQSTVAEKPNLFGRLSDALKPAAQQTNERSRTVIPFESIAGRMVEPPPAASAATPATASEPETPPAPARDEPEIKREMPTFFDTRMARMGTPPPTPPAPEPEDKTAVVSVGAAQPAASQTPQQPPRLPEVLPPLPEGLGADDIAAQLLRPILNQWLLENMPKIVEKALRTPLTPDGVPDQTAAPASSQASPASAALPSSTARTVMSVRKSLR